MAFTTEEIEKIMEDLDKPCPPDSAWNKIAAAQKAAAEAEDKAGRIAQAIRDISAGR